MTAIRLVNAKNDGLGSRARDVVIVTPFNRLKDYVVRSRDQERHLELWAGLEFHTFGYRPNCLKSGKRQFRKGTSDATYCAGTSCKDRRRWEHPIQRSGQREEVPPKRNRVDLRRGNQRLRQGLRNPYTLVLLSVGLCRGAEQGYTKDVPAAGESVLALREDCNTISEFAQVRKLHPPLVDGNEPDNKSYLMTADFKLGEIPGGILVSRTLDMSEGGLVRSDITMDVERYLNFISRSARESTKRGPHVHFRNWCLWCQSTCASKLMYGRVFGLKDAKEVSEIRRT